MANAIMNTTIITFVSPILFIFVGLWAAYPLARRFTSMNIIVFLIFSGIMGIPPLTTLVPLCQWVVNIGLMNPRTIAIVNN